MDAEDRPARHDQGIRNELSGTVLGPVVQAGHIDVVQIHQPATLGVIPRQLRVGADRFVNRTLELAAVDTAVPVGAAAASEPVARPYPVVVLWGPGGVGKSAVALQWLHANSSRFPDGQLCVDLGGGTSTTVTVSEALGTLLRSLDVSPQVIPVSLAERAALFRSLTAGRRVALLLENAVTAAHVRALVPASPRSVVLVTSRSRLAGLSVGLGVEVVAVQPLEEAAAFELLRHSLGATRTEHEPTAIRRLVSLCGGLPLALSVAGARLAARPRFAVAAAVDELTDERRRLAALEIEDDISVRAVFDVSYLRLPEPVARLYRALGSHPGAEFGRGVAAAAVGVDDAEVDAWLAVLVDQSLVSELDDGRYRFHDLGWLHAAEQATAHDTDPAPAEVVERIVDWYLRETVAADLAVTPRRWRVGGIFEDLAGAASAYPDEKTGLAWLERERPNLVAAVGLAARYGLDEAAWQLCVALWSLFFKRKYHEDWLSTHDIGIAATQRLGDRLAEAKLRCQRGFACLELGRTLEAVDDFEQALRAGQQAGDRQAQSTALESLGLAALAARRYGDALDWFDRALTIAEQVGDERALGLLSHHRGRVLGPLGRGPEAFAALTRALAAMRNLGDRYNEARVLTSLGEEHQRTGHIEPAVKAWESALDTMRKGAPFQAAQIALLLATAAQQQNHVERARRYLQEATGHYAELRVPPPPEVLERLAALPPPVSPPRQP
jgi:tetratricopeptide (TPR) repeat protein